MTTKVHAVKLYRQTKDVGFVLRRYHISKASLVRWNKRYDGTSESLRAKSHRPHSQHPNAHTEEEHPGFRTIIAATPTSASVSYMASCGRTKLIPGIPARCTESLYGWAIAKAESTKKKSKHLGHYDTPKELGKKWQMDVKYVPATCYVGKDGDRFYQYTMLEEASRERFIYAYKENSSHSAVDFVRWAIRYFGYAPALIQTDNGGEFTHTQKTDRVHPLDVLCCSLHIEHKTICPRTPWHNGKVERSHRNDQERFYNHLKFYSYADLQLQMKRYLRRANRIPMAVLGWLSPVQKRHQLETARFG